MLQNQAKSQIWLLGDRTLVLGLSNQSLLMRIKWFGVFAGMCTAHACRCCGTSSKKGIAGPEGLRGSYLIDVTNGCADVSSSRAQEELCLHSQLQAQVMAHLSREGQGVLVVSSTCYLERRRHLLACLAATYVSCFFPFLFFYFFLLFSRQVLAQPGLTLTILLPQPLECWNYSHHAWLCCA